MKKGITFLSVMVAVVALAIIATTVIIAVPNVIQNYKLRAFATELMTVQTKIDALNGNYSEYITNDIIVDISDLTDKSMFEGVIENNKVVVQQLNLEALGFYKTAYGNGKTTKDMYCVCHGNNVVYYLEGYETADAKYYALNSDLMNMISGKEDLSNNVGNNVVFIPSTYVKTREGVKVTVKVPAAATGVSVTASGSISPSISNATSVGNYIEYIVNKSSSKGNYTITVLYTLNGENKTASYIVDEYMGVYGILYSDGELRINNDAKVDKYKLEAGNTVVLQSTDITDSTTIPWSSNAASITKVTFENEVMPSYITKWFQNCTNLVEINNMEYLDTSNVTNMACLFKNCSSLSNIEVSGFNTSKVTRMDQMFNGCTNLKILDLTSFYSPNLTRMDQMFYNCTNLETLNLTGLTTPNRVNFSETFKNCKKVKSLDLSGITKITTLYATFQSCCELEKLDLSHIDTTGIVYMMATFLDCRSLEELNLTGIDTSMVTNMGYCFQDCKKLKTLDISGFVTTSNTSCNYMFKGCSSLEYLELSNFSTQNVTSMYGMFRECSVLNNIDTSGFVMTNCTTTAYMFNKCFELETIDLTGVTTSKVKEAQGMFYECNNLVSVDARNWSSSALNDISNMLYGCDKLKTVYLNSLNNLSGAYMMNSFYNSRQIEYLDIRSLSFEGVTVGTSFLPAFVKNATIIVSDDTAKAWIKEELAVYGSSQDHVTVKTVAEL